MPLIRTYKNNAWIDIQVDDTMPTMSPAQIVTKLDALLEEYSLEKYPAGHRAHLGASLIGEECWRKLWYGFRWVKLLKFEGRMRRLFNRGHREEAQIEAFLLWAGIKIRTIDPETDKQYLFSAINGHYGGSSDGIALLGWCDDLPIVPEFKTHNDRLFELLKKNKLKLAQPKHYAQMCQYGKAFKIKHGLYVAVNKDTDEIYFEFVELDWNYASELEKKATDIIYSPTAPLRVAMQETSAKCVYCDFKGICWKGEPIEVNCRSCKFAEPVETGKWKCHKFGQDIPKNFIAKGCDQHQSINQ